MKRFVLAVVLFPIKLAALFCALVVLTTSTDAHVSVRLLSHNMPVGPLIAVLYIVPTLAIILLLDWVDNRRNKREGKLPTETRQFIVDNWRGLRTLWRAKNLLICSLVLLFVIAVAPPLYRWVTANANSINALGTVILAALTALYVSLTGILARANNRLLRSQTEAAVIVYTGDGAMSSGHPTVVTHNVGRGVATNIRLTIRVPDPIPTQPHASILPPFGPIEGGSLLPDRKIVLPLIDVPWGSLPREGEVSIVGVMVTWEGESALEDKPSAHERTFSLRLARAAGTGRTFDAEPTEMAAHLTMLARVIRDGQDTSSRQVAEALHDLSSAFRDAMEYPRNPSLGAGQTPKEHDVHARLATRILRGLRHRT
jgi:hypothetical protein